MKSCWTTRAFAHLGPLDDLTNPIWTASICPLIAMAALVLALTPWGASSAMFHLWMSLAFLQMLTLGLTMFLAKNIVVNRHPDTVDGPIHPIWLLRILPLILAALILLAEFVYRDFLTGLSLGMTFGVLLVGLQITQVITRQIPAAR